MDLELTETYQEIISQTIAWEEAIKVVRHSTPSFHTQWKRGHVTNAIFTVCGSTYYLSLSAASFFQEMKGIPSRAATAGEPYL